MKFRIQVLIRILLAIAFGIAAYYVFFETNFWLLACWMLLFFIISIIELIRYVERTERDLSNFLIAIKQNDFTNHYPSEPKAKKLFQAFNLITDSFIQLRNEKESNFHFLQTVVEHSGVPLLAYQVETEKIALVNKSFKELFAIPHLTKLTVLDRLDGDLCPNLRQMKSGDKLLLRVNLKNDLTYLSIVAKELELGGVRAKVIAFHNINAELDQQEVESWQKLIRVMTHEIKNSVIPISTLTEVINDMFKNDKGERGIAHLTAEDEEDLLLSMQTIEKRSKGLVKFVTSYGDLAKVPVPKCEKVDLVQLIQEVVQLEEKTLKNIGISLKVDLPNHPIMHSLDHDMISHVLINLLKNGVEALQEANIEGAELKVILENHLTEVVVRVEDNGPGMSVEIKDQIFIPFFTTKESGSGIGLSFSKQIMRAHRGNLRVKSNLGNGTIFEMSFWKY